jgi:hypothetical protein
MLKKDLKVYLKWYFDVLPDRINELAEAIKKTPGFESWRPDYTPTSLDPLGSWFCGQVEARLRTSEEIEELSADPIFSVYMPEEELTNRTFSLAIDIGVYLSQVLLKNNPSLRWGQPLGSKKHIDYGQPVLVKFRSGPFNPVRMMITHAYGLISGDRGPSDLSKIYEIWTEMIQTTT